MMLRSSERMLVQPGEDLIGALAWGEDRIEHGLDPVFLDDQGA